MIIKEYPNNNTFYNDEIISFDGLVISLKSNKNEYIIKDYQLDYDVILGEVKVFVYYEDYETFFYINIIERKKESLINHIDYSDKTTHSIIYDDYINIVEDISYSSTRGANMIIMFNQNNIVKTNIYGYEILVDEYGKIIEKDINVELTSKGMVISAHGTRVKDIKNLNIGDYVLLLNNYLYVYDGSCVSNANDVFLKFEELTNNVKLIEEVKVYNEVIAKLNDVIPLLNNLYNSYDSDLHQSVKTRLEDINIPFYDLENHTYAYSYNDEIYDIYNNDYIIDSNSSMFLLQTRYNDVIYIGGFRNKDQIHYYDENCYRERNSFGYEIAVDKNGIVVDKDILVDLPEGGYILSGHSSGASFITNNIMLFDKIVLTDDTFEVYRDNMFLMRNNIYSRVNELLLAINEEKESEIPHDYNYIDEIVKHLKIEIDNLDLDNPTLYNVIIQQEKTTLINHYVSLCYGQLIDYDESKTRGIWYYPFNKNNVHTDTTLEGVRSTLVMFKEMGINEVVLNPFNGNYALFESSVHEISSVLDDCYYGEYGNDFLMCFIEEAHKLGISVNAFTQTFANKSSSFKNKENGFYQIDYQGNQSLGSIYYYDICNDELQSVLLTWYEELVTKYNFDKIEYDIIRYPSSNLYNYLDVETISDDITITDHGYTEYSMNKFMTLYGYSGDLRTLIKTSKEVRLNWLKFKEDELISFITECTNLIKSIKPNTTITAAVLNDYDNARKSYLQDCKKWLELGILDEIEPMVYTSSTNVVYDKINYYNELIPEYNFRVGLSPRLTLRDVLIDLKQVKLAMDYNGYILFANNLYNDKEFINILKSSYHITEGENTLERICNDLINKIEKYYEVKDNVKYDSLTSLLSDCNVSDAIIEASKLDNIMMKNYILNILKKLSN